MKLVREEDNHDIGESMASEIQTDGKTVWVNTGICLGRFSRFGIDVHKAAKEQMKGGSQCLDCYNEPDWERFKASMLRFHGVSIGDEYRPEWVSEQGR